MALKNPLFEESYGRIFGPDVGVGDRADPFFDQFYDRFLQRDAVAELFANTDMKRQKAMLKHSIFLLVSYYVTGIASAELERLSELHGRLNLPPKMFDDWLEALVETVIDMDPDADQATLLAWCWAMMPGITFMRIGLR